MVSLGNPIALPFPSPTTLFVPEPVAMAVYSEWVTEDSSAGDVYTRFHVFPSFVSSMVNRPLYATRVVEFPSR